MIFSRKSKKQAETGSATLTLRTADGAPLAIFPADIASSYRRMITGLVCRETLPAKIALVAALREEGVTYTGLALATTMASDLAGSVCLVELNWWAPGLQQMLGTFTEKPSRRKRKQPAPAPAARASIPQSPGIAAILTEQASIDDALIKTDLANLALLPAGTLPLDRRALTARSAGLQQCINQLNQRFDHLILDIPAVLVTSDAIALASLADAACIVARQGVTPAPSVRQALDEVKHLSMLGVVMNRTQIKTPGWILNLIPQE